MASVWSNSLAKPPSGKIALILSRISPFYTLKDLFVI